MKKKLTRFLYMISSYFCVLEIQLKSPNWNVVIKLIFKNIMRIGKELRKSKFYIEFRNNIKLGDQIETKSN